VQVFAPPRHLPWHRTWVDQWGLLAWYAQANRVLNDFWRLLCCVSATCVRFMSCGMPPGEAILCWI
jgi:hypothetical protein